MVSFPRESLFIVQDLLTQVYNQYEQLPTPLPSPLSFSEFLTTSLSAWTATNLHDTPWFADMRDNPYFAEQIFACFATVFSRTKYEKTVLERVKEMEKEVIGNRAEGGGEGAEPGFGENSIGLMGSTEETMGESPVTRRKRSKPLAKPPTPPHDFGPPPSAVSIRHPLSLLSKPVKSRRKPGVKKECFRIQHIRGLKKSIRDLSKSRMPGVSIHRVDWRSSTHVQRWQSLQDYFAQFQAQLLPIADTAAGPKTDGKRTRKSQQEPSKSYNDAYCRDFFRRNVVRGYHKLYCEVVYCGEAEDMCAKIGARCCDRGGNGHTGDCQAVWQEIKRYASEGMIRELGIEDE